MRVTYQASNHSAQVENHPEPGDVAALGSFRWVRHHDGTLGAPQQTSAYTEQRTGESGEAQVLCVVVGQVRRHINGIANTANGQSSADAELVGEGSGEKANNGEGRVQSRVCAIVCGRIELASAAHAVESIEHTRAHEAHDGDNDQLDRRGCEPWQFEAQDSEALVLPRVGKFKRIAVGHRMVGGADIVGRKSALFVGRHFRGCGGVVGADARGKLEAELKQRVRNR